MPAAIVEAVKNATMDPGHDHLNEFLDPHPDPLSGGPPSKRRSLSDRMRFSG